MVGLTPAAGDAVAEIFRRAAEVIATNGLNKHTYCSPVVAPDPTAPFAGGRAVCTIGAMRVAVGLEPTPAVLERPHDEEPLIWDAIAFLSPRVESPIVDENPIERVAAWSDGPAVSADAVAAELLLAAEAVSS